MRVLFITNLFPPFFLGGYEVACKDITDEFKNTGHSVFVLTSDFGIKYPYETNNIFRVLRIKLDFESVFDKIFSLFYNPYNYRKILEIIKRIKPDIASVWSINGISAAPIFALKKKRIPYVVHLFDRSLSFLRKNGWKGILNPFLYNKLNFDHIISCSDSLKSDYVKRGFKEESITVIHHGIIPEKKIIDKKRIDSKNLKLLFVGQLWEAKGADLAIRSLPLLEKNGIFANLTIIGDGLETYKQYLRKITKECNVIDRVIFVGRISREALKNFYRRKDILLFPTNSWYKEPFGIVIIEAMNQGIPVIASNSGGPREIIMNGENGLLFGSGNVESFTEKIMLLASDVQLYEAIRKKAFDRIKEQFDISVVGEKTIEYYTNISKKL